MENEGKRTNLSRAVPFIAGTLFGCLSIILVGLCLLAGAFFAFRNGASGVAMNPAADPVENGQRVFQSMCSHCHSTETDLKVGPGLAGLFSSGGPELPPGVDYGGNLPNGDEITEANVAAWIREGGSGEIGSMPSMPVGSAQMDSLIAYLKTLEK